MTNQSKPVPLYDSFSATYDFFVNWPQRLEFEMPFIQAQLTASRANAILDVGCGTGQHTLALASQGYQLTGIDPSQPMIEQARANAARAGAAVRLDVAGFGQIVEKVGDGFDALLCLGNSLPHAITDDDLQTTLQDFAGVLQPGGLLLIQNRNFDSVLNARDRWMPPQSHTRTDGDWIFLRFYDFNPDGTITFNVVTLKRHGDQAWDQKVESTLLRPWLQPELVAALTANGFTRLVCYGDMQGSPFEPAHSGNLVITAEKAANPDH